MNSLIQVEGKVVSVQPVCEGSKEAERSSRPTIRSEAEDSSVVNKFFIIKYYKILYGI